MQENTNRMFTGAPIQVYGANNAQKFFQAAREDALELLEVTGICALRCEQAPKKIVFLCLSLL